MNVLYRETASTDVVRQFRYYLLEKNLPDVADRFLDAIRHTVEPLRQHPLIGPRYLLSGRPALHLRSWPIAGFEAIRIYYLVDSSDLHVIRVLHGKRDLKTILEGEANA